MDIQQGLLKLWESTGIMTILNTPDPKIQMIPFSDVNISFTDMNSFLSGLKTLMIFLGGHIEQILHIHGSWMMLLICLFLLWLGIKKQFEPLLLVPIAFGGLLINMPCDHTLQEFVYKVGVDPAIGIFPLIIFMGVGAMTDFGPLIANPKTALLGGAAQFGIFGALLLALALDFSLSEAASIGIIGGADGPTSIFVTSRLAKDLLGPIAVAAYSYMALVPVIQPPIMKWLTTEAERKIQMTQLREVTKREKIVFPLVVLALCVIFLPDACPLVGCLAFGNLAKECGVVDRLSDTMQNALINIITIFLGLAVGSKLQAKYFLTLETLKILILGILAFMLATAAGVLMAKLMNICIKFSAKLQGKEPTLINPLIGSAGVSAVPMAARVSNKVGLEANPQNFLLMHAMGPNVSGVIGSAVAAGVLLALCG